MKEKITSALLILLILISMGVLLATPSRPVVETVPPTTEETVPQTTPPPEDALPRVAELLDRKPLSQTALSTCIYNDTLHRARNLTGADKTSPAHALARLCGERKMNPISALWVLTGEGLYRKTSEGEGKISVPAVRTPEVEVRAHPYTAEGVQAFLTELLTLSGELEDGLPLDAQALGGNKVQVHLEKGECYYAYYVCYSPEAAHFLCFYIRGSETITDVEFQLLNLRYADGSKASVQRIDQLGDRQAAALMTAAELLLTGSSRAALGRIPLGYALEDHTVTIERFTIEGSGDTGTLTNYRIRK